MQNQEQDPEQPTTIRTKLKFVKSDKTDAIISFASQNPKTGRICGVREDSPYPKKVCVLEKRLVPDIVLNALYDVEMIPMHKKDGYIVVDASPVRFKASIYTTYVKKAIYKLEVKFGNKTIVFDPVDGKKDSVRVYEECLALLESRIDLQDHELIIADFKESATKLLKLMQADGVYYKYGNNKKA